VKPQHAQPSSAGYPDFLRAEDRKKKAGKKSVITPRLRAARKFPKRQYRKSRINLLNSCPVNGPSFYSTVFNLHRHGSFACRGSHRKTSIPPSMKIRHALVTAALASLLGTSISHAAPAAENWENHCTKCHGEDGKGQTKVGKKLQLQDYTDAAFQAKVTDEEMTKIINDGVKDKAGKEKMKSYKDELSADEIKDLVAHIRKFKA